MLPGHRAEQDHADHRQAEAEVLLLSVVEPARDPCERSDEEDGGQAVAEDEKLPALRQGLGLPPEVVRVVRERIEEPAEEAEDGQVIPSHAEPGDPRQDVDPVVDVGLRPEDADRHQGREGDRGQAGGHDLPAATPGEVREKEQREKLDRRGQADQQPGGPRAPVAFAGPGAEQQRREGQAQLALEEMFEERVTYHGQGDRRQAARGSENDAKLPDDDPDREGQGRKAKKVPGHVGGFEVQPDEGERQEHGRGRVGVDVDDEILRAGRGLEIEARGQLVLRVDGQPLEDILAGGVLLEEVGQEIARGLDRRALDEHGPLECDQVQGEDHPDRVADRPESGQGIPEPRRAGGRAGLLILFPFEYLFGLHCGTISGLRPVGLIALHDSGRACLRASHIQTRLGRRHTLPESRKVI